jgi:hypothetical protein
MIHFHNSDRPAPLHNREGLTTYLNTTTAVPETLSDSDYAALGPVARNRYDRARVVYLSGGILIETPSLTRAKKVLHDCFNDNIGRNSGHTGLILNGDSTVGKTTTTKALMQYVYNAYKRQSPGFDVEQTVPVVYIEVPAGSTGKLLIKTFAEFFGMTVRSGESMVSLRSRVTSVIAAAGTQLIVVDELHNLASKTAGNGESVDVLKSLHNDLPCTFVYAGIDLTDGRLLAGPRGQQLSARFDIMPMSRFNLSRAEDRKTWKQLINAFEAKLPLRHHEKGTLATMQDYLFERTNGSIGSLSRLITGSAIETITNPKIEREHIDRDLLDSRRLDFAAEFARVGRAKRRANPLSAANALASVGAL